VLAYLSPVASASLIGLPALALTLINSLALCCITLVTALIGVTCLFAIALPPHLRIIIINAYRKCKYKIYALQKLLLSVILHRFKETEGTMTTRLGMALLNSLQTLGISQIEMAEKSNLCQATINKIISKKFRVDEKTLNRITNAIDKTKTLCYYPHHQRHIRQRARLAQPANGHPDGQQTGTTRGVIMRDHQHGEIRTEARKFSAAQIIPVYRRGTPYTRLMQIGYSLRTSRNIDGEDWAQITRGCKSLISTGFCQWALMRNYWCYSGPGHEQMIVRRLPLRTAIKIEFGGRVMRPILNAKQAAADWITWTLPAITRNAINQLNPIRIIRERREQRAWDNMWASK
jgi:transcriptional regulator with XRE-family HTH domain